MAQIRARRYLLVVWAVAWLCCAVSLDVLHNSEHVLESDPHHSCLVCQFGH